MGLIDDLGSGPVAVDTSVFIYFIEEHPDYLPIVKPLFEQIDAFRRTAMTSALTLLEVLVVPYRAGNLDLGRRYEALLIRSTGLRLVEISREQLKMAAQLRALHPSVKTPDALQLAAALTGRSRTLLTNDRQLPDLPGLSVIQLRDYLR